MSSVTGASSPPESESASISDTPRPALCSGFTKSGERCRNHAAEGSVFCHLHDPRAQGRTASRGRPKPYASQAHRSKVAEGGDDVVQVVATFSRAPTILKNLVGDLVLTLKARELWKGQRSRPQFDGVTDAYLEFREILANLSLTCAGCGVDFRLYCDAGFQDPILATRQKTWHLEHQDGCPLCSSRKVRIEVRNNDMLTPRMDLADSLILTAGLLAIGAALYSLWWGTVLGLLAKLALSILAACALLLASAWVVGVYDERRLFRKPRRSEEDPDALYPPVPIGGDSTPLAAAQQIRQAERRL